MAMKAKQAKPSELRVSAEGRQVLERLLAVVQAFRDVDPDEMTARRMEIFLAVALHPERSLIEHGLSLGMGTLASYRHGSAWCDLNVNGKEGYGLMLAADRPFYEGGEAPADRRSARRKHVALNARGAQLVERVLLALKD